MPGIVYGAGVEPRPFKVAERDLRTVLAGGEALIDLEIEGSEPVPVVLKERQLHPVRDQILHIDFQKVDLAQKIHAAVALDLEGTDDAPGVKLGGVLEHILREVNIEALPAGIPERLTLDVSAMEINDTLQLSALSVPSGVELLDDPETTVATLSPPRVEEEPEPALEEEAELVGEEGEAPEEGAEGEAPAEGGESAAEGGEGS